MKDDISRAQVSAGCEVMVAIAVSIVFLLPSMFSAPYFPIGLSFIAMAGLLICSAVSLRTGLQLWTVPVALVTSVMLLLVLIWAANGRQAIAVPIWSTTLSIVRIALLTSVVVTILSLARIGQKPVRFGATFATIALGVAIVLCLAIAPHGLEPVEAAFWLPAIVAAISFVVTLTSLVRSRITLQH
jgi:hypothetical protein